MYRVVVFKSTGKLIPWPPTASGDAPLSPGTVDAEYVVQKLQVMIAAAVAAGYAENDAVQNLTALIIEAIAAGYSIDDIEAKFISDADWATLQVQQNQAAQTSRDYAALVVIKNKQFNQKVAKTLNIKGGI